VFTPQAAAAINVMTEPAQRGRAITFVFLGWSLASVLGMPLRQLHRRDLGLALGLCVVGVMSLAAAAACGAACPTA
jgi:DHA1 family inner membrane transport protein